MFYRNTDEVSMIKASKNRAQQNPHCKLATTKEREKERKKASEHKHQSILCSIH
jgi:hypothetical protein